MLGCWQTQFQGEQVRGRLKMEGLMNSAPGFRHREPKISIDDFSATEPPAGLTPAIAGLWWDAKGDWTRAPLRYSGLGGSCERLIMCSVTAMPSNSCQFVKQNNERCRRSAAAEQKFCWQHPPSSFIWWLCVVVIQRWMT